MDGEYVLNSLDEDSSAQLFDMNSLMADLTDLVDTTEVEEFVEYYGELIDALGDIADQLPPNLKALYELLLQVATKENMIYLVKCLPYLKDSEAGFDLLTFTNNADGSVTMERSPPPALVTVTATAWRVFAETTDYFIIGTASPFLWQPAVAHQEHRCQARAGSQREACRYSEAHYRDRYRGRDHRTRG